MFQLLSEGRKYCNCSSRANENVVVINVGAWRCRVMSKTVVLTVPMALILRLCSSHWTSSGYPDLRGPSVLKCSVEASPGSLHYVCDPDHVLNATEGKISIQC